MQISTEGIDFQEIREQFPALDQLVYGKPLIYLDNAATTQKPWAVLRAIQSYYQNDNANVHRGVHQLSQRATDAYESAREKVQRFINARNESEIIFTKGCTEAINLVAQSWGRQNLKAGDEILLSGMEHHSNIVPWQMVAESVGAIVRPIPVTDRGEVDFDEFKRMLNPHVKLVGMVHVSNSLGTINAPGIDTNALQSGEGAQPAVDDNWIHLAHEIGAKVLLDGAQALAHMRVDVQSLDVDFYTMSAHKMYGPTGMGALYAKRELLESMPPYQGGGDMIRSVSFEKTTYSDIPNKFEAGTPNIAGAIGWGAAIDWLSEFEWSQLVKYERELERHLSSELSKIEGVKILGDTVNKAGVVSFVIDGVHPHDVGTILDREGIAVRAGHHCCMPVMTRFGVAGTTRVSLGLYNTLWEVDQLVRALGKVKEIFG